MSNDLKSDLLKTHERFEKFQEKERKKKEQREERRRRRPTRSKSKKKKKNVKNNSLVTINKELLKQRQTVRNSERSRQLVFQIVNFLEQADRRPISKKEIKDNLGIDLFSIQNEELNQQIIEQLDRNPKIQIQNEMFVYIPNKNIKNKSDILRILMHEYTGISSEEIADSYKTIKQDILELKEEKKIRVIRNDERNFDVLFYIDHKSEVGINQVFKKKWAEVTLPDETDLPKQMQQQKLHQFETIQVRNKQSENQRKKKRRFKPTNSHLPEYDKLLNQN
ncbi:transcription initiation factor iie beta subunit [Anaeramoeba flamelloides]|uniref:Transcription initiation factor iie beta subunit n=1 Tax=Anaeramoeba flamelloides TaxID=1746091 RepID=A0AAV7YQX0_9EUKA|nr:transcription initiation factor iie beta subunit [Anaeramoeba flamelloides]|eukprot:Anaeramoba_flamelloidesa1058097_42.p1 GENE.a1058097_42~~a1058097_42.p1  ORF type:complete len:279 (-),score=90.94 a1058097_42:38-874(-)